MQNDQPESCSLADHFFILSKIEKASQNGKLVLDGANKM